MVESHTGVAKKTEGNCLFSRIDPRMMTIKTKNINNSSSNIRSVLFIDENTTEKFE